MVLVTVEETNAKAPMRGLEAPSSMYQSRCLTLWRVSVDWLRLGERTVLDLRVPFGHGRLGLRLLDHSVVDSSF